MACETPVIASNKGALPEVVDEGALLVDPKNSLEIADAMIQIISNNLVRNKIIREGRERVKLYKWEIAAKKIECVLKDIQG